MSSEERLNPNMLPEVPPEIIDYCSILGVSHENLSIGIVERAYWKSHAGFFSRAVKKQEPGDDLADADLVQKRQADIDASWALLRVCKWIRENSGPSNDPQLAGVPRKPLPSSGSSEIALPLPEPEGEES